MEYTWDFTSVWRNWEVLLQGVGVTIVLSLASISIGLLLSFPIAFLRKSKLKFVAWLSLAFIEVFRDLPVLVVLVWLFYCLPILLGNNVRLTPFAVAVMGLALNFTALQAEIFRAGLEAIPLGQLEIARTLGFSRYQIARYIVIPQAPWMKKTAKNLASGKVTPTQYAKKEAKEATVAKFARADGAAQRGNTKGRII